MSRVAAHPKSFPTTQLPALRKLVADVVSGAVPSPRSPNQMLLPPFVSSGAATAAAAAPAADEPPVVLYRDDKCFVARDAYPKSTWHCLVIPTDRALQSLNDLRQPALHVPLLEHMHRVGVEFGSFVRRSAPSEVRRLKFTCGFHAIPSLPTLHMHVLSLDLESPRLKHKKHYNSFATRFFLPAAAVISDLARNGRVTLNQDVEQLLAFESQPMQCLWCGVALENMPAVRQHVPTCKRNAARDPIVG